MKTIGKINGFKLLADLSDDEQIISSLTYEDLTRDLRDRLKEKNEKLKSQSNTMAMFIEPVKKELILTKDEYEQIIAIKESVICHRSVSDAQYLKYLLQSLIVKELKDICREKDIRGYSKLKRDELVDFIIDSLSIEEKRDYIIENESEIIGREVAKALTILNGKGKDKLEKIEVKNEKTHHLELTFSGFKWETATYIIINDSNIADPERYCDCKIGIGMGFCPHFWIGFIESLKRKYFTLKDWNLTYVPDVLNQFSV